MTDQEVRDLIDEAKDEILQRVDETHVRKDTCNDVQTQNAKKFANDDKRIELFAQKVKSWDKLFWAIATSAIGQVVLSLANLIKG